MKEVEDKKAKEFLTKLKKLLKEYNAMIGFTCSESSDIYGIYDESISIDIDNTRIKDISGWWMDESDLKI